MIDNIDKVMIEKVGLPVEPNMLIGTVPKEVKIVRMKPSVPIKQLDVERIFKHTEAKKVEVTYSDSGYIEWITLYFDWSYTEEVIE